MREDNFPRPVSDPEGEGLPRTADDDSTAYDDVDSPREADGPDPAPLPADEPQAVDRFGVTPEDARLGESVDYKLGRELPDELPDELPGELPDEEPAPVPGREDDGAAVDEGAALDDEIDRPDRDAALFDASPPVPPPDSPVSVYDIPDVVSEVGTPIGRLVEPDEGAHPDEEPDAVAYDAGAAGGGASAEELAMHEVTEP